MIELKTAAEIDAMAEAGRVVAAVHSALRAHARPGVSLLELDELARTVIADAGAKPSFLGYHPSFGATPFPGVICTSVNGVMLHGLPPRPACWTATCSASTAAPTWTTGTPTRR